MALDWNREVVMIQLRAMNDGEYGEHMLKLMRQYAAERLIGPSFELMGVHYMGYARVFAASRR